MSDHAHGVLVGVGADGAHDGALDLAAAEAIRRDTGVEMVHVVNPLVATPRDVHQLQSVEQALGKVGNQVLADAASRMRERLDGRQEVATQLFSGRVAATIAEHADGAELVVLERRDPNLVDRLLTMSVSTWVAGRARPPVAVVPRRWSPAAEPGPVTVGVEDPMEALGQVRTAAQYASAAGRPLVVLYAAWLPEPYQDMVFMEYTRHDWIRDATHALESSLRALRPDLPPSLDVTVDVGWARPTDALVRASRSSSTLVLSRSPAVHPVGTHLGPVTRAVLHHTECPVLVVDHG